MTKQERLEKQRQRLEEMKKPEAELHENGYRYIAGVDEVGRGPLAGPVVAAAVVMPEDFDVPGIDDSEKLPEKKREEMFDVIKQHAVCTGIGMFIPISPTIVVVTDGVYTRVINAPIPTPIPAIKKPKIA